MNLTTRRPKDGLPPGQQTELRDFFTVASGVRVDFERLSHSEQGELLSLARSLKTPQGANWANLSAREGRRRGWRGGRGGGRGRGRCPPAGGGGGERRPPPRPLPPAAAGGGGGARRGPRAPRPRLRGGSRAAQRGRPASPIVPRP